MKEVLKYSGLKVDEIYAVELIGGGTRVPKLQVCTVFFLMNLLMTQTLISYSSREKLISFNQLDRIVGYSIYMELYGILSHIQAVKH